MAKQLIAVTWCDVCMTDDNRETKAGNSHVIRLDDVTRELDLCDDHEATLVAPVIDAVRYGAAPESTARPRGRLRNEDDRETGHECPICHNAYQTRATMLSHVRQQHDTTLGVYLASKGKGDGSEIRTCPECGFQCSSPQGLGAHRRHTHGVRGASYNAKRDDQPALDGDE